MNALITYDKQEQLIKSNVINCNMIEINHINNIKHKPFNKYLDQLHPWHAAGRGRDPKLERHE